MTDSNADSPRASSSMDAQTFACCAARVMSDSKCEDVIVLDVRGLCQIADFFVIASGTSDRQIQSVAHELEDFAADQNYSSMGVQGGASAQWVVADFVDVVVHLFEPQTRAYYDLESLWADAESLDWAAVTKPGQFVRVSGGRGARSAGH